RNAERAARRRSAPLPVRPGHRARQGRPQGARDQVGDRRAATRAGTRAGRARRGHRARPRVVEMSRALCLVAAALIAFTTLNAKAAMPAKNSSFARFAFPRAPQAEPLFAERAAESGLA